MFYMKQAAYRDRKKRAAKNENAEDKGLRKLRDRLRYLKNVKVPKIDTDIKALKEDQKKSNSKKKKGIIKRKLEQLIAEKKVIEAEEADLRNRVSSMQ